MESRNWVSGRKSLHSTDDLPVKTLKHIQLSFWLDPTALHHRVDEGEKKLSTAQGQ